MFSAKRLEIIQNVVRVVFPASIAVFVMDCKLFSCAANDTLVIIALKRSLAHSAIMNLLPLNLCPAFPACLRIPFALVRFDFGKIGGNIFSKVARLTLAP